MCCYSVMIDYGQSKIWPQWSVPMIPTIPYVRDLDEEKRKIEAFMEALDAAKKLDEAAGQPDCEDPDKAKFEQIMIKRLDQIERKIAEMEKPKKAIANKPKKVIKKPVKKVVKKK